MSTSKYISRFLVWREKNLKYRSFVLIISLLVGILSGFAALLLKSTVHYTSHFLTFWLHVEKANFIYFAYPLFGIFLTVLFVKYFVKDNIGHGISRILYAISKKNSLLKSHNSYTSMIASTLTVGFGGSLGLEAPIVLTGSSIGSNIGRMLRLNYKTTTLLIGCGAAGAIAGIFKAPVAAIIFALEVLMLDLTIASLIPLLISSVAGATISHIFSGKEFIFSVHLEGGYSLGNIPYYIVLGIVTGLISLYFTRGTMFVETMLGKIRAWYQKLFVGGAILGLLIFLFPPLFGEGYESLMSIMDGNAGHLLEGSVFYTLKDNFLFFIGFLLLVVFFKVVAASITTGSGGVGGIFAPTLFMGGIIGYVVARILNTISFVSISEKHFALAGMSGMMAGVMHAPLTAIFLIAEITGGYTLFVPLMITSTMAFLTINRFETHSIYTHRLAKRRELITHDKDSAILTHLDIKKVVEKDFKTVKMSSTLRELVVVISKSKRNIFPVIDDNNILVGIIFMDNIRDIIFNHEMYDTTYVENLMITPACFIEEDEPMENVIQKFESSGEWNIPVVKNGQYQGFVSKSKLFSIYRKRLLDISQN